MILAVKISQENTKADILADYLNAIYFGRGCLRHPGRQPGLLRQECLQPLPSEGALLAG